ncbi:MAG TPA: hypothetical protein PKV72_02590 [Candidatus Peribacteria bacterium]|nr:hypothetical protein [Candidatus Peribacteria bacterium]
MKHTLHLTSAERGRFESLSKDLRRGCSVHDETQTAYETPDELALRVSMSSMEQHPEFCDAIGRMHAGEANVQFDWDSIPESLWSEMCFALGARGLTIIIDQILPEPGAWDPEDLEFLSGMTIVRHKLLEINAATSSPTHA